MTSRQDNELEKIIVNYIMPAHMHNGIDKRAEAKQALTSWKDKEVEETVQKCIDLMKDIMQENFHYRLMCGEIRDPEGKIDVMQEFVRYQELEPERKKFSEYLEDRIRTLKESDE